MTTQKETLQPKDIVGYIANGGLKSFQYFEEQPLYRDITYYNVESYCNGDIQAKPLLFPLSHLTKEIPFNGGTIVPMYEMLKKSELGFEKQSVKYKANKNVYGVSYIDLEGFENGFTYSSDTRSFATYHLADKKLFITRNEFDLFQLLYQYKIDFLGLIDKGLAVDVSTVENKIYG